MELQPFTYSIKTGGWLEGSSLALPHGLGHGWARPLGHGLGPREPARVQPERLRTWNMGGNNRAIQYVMDGLKFQGCNPDTCTVWARVRPSRPRLRRRAGDDEP
jgi:hypothetical protein